MPLKSFKCPDLGEIECSKCISENGCRMQSRCCSRPVLKLMYDSQREWKGKPSTTQLIKGTMSAFLEIKHDYTVSPDKMIFMLHGSGVHKMLEEKGDEISKAELDLSDKDGSVRPDLIETEGGINTLVDYKTCGSYQIAKSLGIYFEDVPTVDPVTQVQVLYKTGPKKGKPKTHKEKRVDSRIADIYDWALQLNNYRIGIEKTLKIKIHKLVVQALVRDGGTVVAIGRGVERNIYLIDIPKVPDAEIKEYFLRKKKNLLLAVQQGHWSTPCDEHERWGGHKCQEYCNVNKHCPYYLETYSKNVDTEAQAASDEEKLGPDGCPVE